jgi:hypothetical protein
MSEAEELRSKAARAVRLAQMAYDDAVAANLKKFAAELLERARRLEAATNDSKSRP